MTLPSLRKLPTTQPNTLTFAEFVRLSLAALGLATVAVSPVWGDVTPTGSDSAAARRIGGGHTPWRQLSGPEEEAGPARAAPKTTGSLKSRVDAGRPAAKLPAGRSIARKPQRGLKQVAFEEVAPPTTELAETERAETELVEAVPPFEGAVEELPEWPQEGARIGPPMPVADDVESCERREGVPVNRLAQREVPEFQDQLEKDAQAAKLKLVRPFRQMKQIRPHYDYEPDDAMVKQDKCYNLCPRPGMPDCPDCDPNDLQAGEGGLVCPDCPTEAVLSELDRQTPSINDFPVRSFAHIHYCWEPTNMSAFPLYFEDVELERYGHTRHYLIDPPFKVGLFSLQLIGLPYQMTIDPPWKKRYALGFYRPGQFVCPKYYQVPWNTKAAAVEASVLTGSYFLFAPGFTP